MNATEMTQERGGTDNKVEWTTKGAQSLRKIMGLQWHVYIRVGPGKWGRFQVTAMRLGCPQKGISERAKGRIELGEVAWTLEMNTVKDICGCG